MNEFDLASLNLIDGLMGLIIFFGIIIGWSRGFILSAMQIITLVFSLLVAFVAYQYPAVLLREYEPSLGHWIAPVCFLVTYAIAHLAIGAVAGSLANAVPPRAHIHLINRLLGVLPGFVNGVINAAIATLLLITLPLSDRISIMARDSALAGRLSAPAEWLEARLVPIFHPAITRTMQALTGPKEPAATVKLSYKVEDAKVRPDLEARMLEMLNAERIEQGLNPLQADPALADVARVHSRDMFARGYFSHVNPEGKDAFDRLQQAKIRYLAAGENLALAQTLPSAHQGLMNSPGHRANILRPAYGRVGIGVLDGGKYGLMITQEFRN